jgi:hypothetical protein
MSRSGSLDLAQDDRSARWRFTGSTSCGGSVHRALLFVCTDISRLMVPSSGDRALWTRGLVLLLGFDYGKRRVR